MHQPPTQPVYCLTRTVRFNLPIGSPTPAGRPGGATSPDDALAGGCNGEGGKPAMNAFGAHYEFEVRCTGEPNPETGYLINIKDIDKAVRTGVVPRIARAAHAGDTPASIMPGLLAESDRLLPVRVVSVVLRLSPYLTVEAVRARTEPEAGMPDTDTPQSTHSAQIQPDAQAHTRAETPTEVIVRQMLEFSAAHRLHVPGLGDAENEQLFGKCNNPAGHGHNYRIEPAVAVDPDNPMTVDAIERITDDVVIERFDHKHLNDQTAEFATDGGLNPSVENIARVCYGLLDGPIADAGGRLKAVTVWETDRTSCTFPGSHG